jgi:hypothetical protein
MVSIPKIVGVMSCGLLLCLGLSNTRRPHSALGYRPPAPETRMVTPIGLSA